MNKKVIGILIFVLLALLIVGIKLQNNYEENLNSVSDNNAKSLIEVTVATGGGKEDFLADSEVNEILASKYGIKATYDSWSNGKMIKNELVRDNGDTYDLMFCSDQRFYDYFRVAADKSKGEADRQTVLTGGLTLNTPIVIYSWANVVDALIEQGIVSQVDGVYYITDMNKLLQYILDGKTWKEIGLNQYGTINISSTDPVTSSPGATYYGLLLSILSGGNVTDNNLEENLPKLKEFYEKSGYMNNTPSDLFERYLKMGEGAYPMIVDYEKSIIEFINSNPDGYDQVKDNLRILYPTPTIWNSHCIAAFTENGEKYYEAFNDTDIQQIAWSKYGFRTGVSTGNYDVSSVGISGIPQNITSTVTSLKMSMYNRLIEYLGQ